MDLIVDGKKVEEPEPVDIDLVSAQCVFVGKTFGLTLEYKGSNFLFTSKIIKIERAKP